MSNHSIRFTKMQALGNDFVVIDGVNQKITLNKSQIAQLGERHLGIGFDQLLLIESSDTADFFCRIFNNDGTEAEQCGNGLRCVARFIHEQKLHAGPTILIATKSGKYEVFIKNYDAIRMSMGVPTFEPEKIPFTATSQQKIYELPLLDDRTLSATVLALGNPHAVIRVDSIAETPIKQWGSHFSTHPLFPQGVNVGFMEIVDKSHIILRTFERGAGETHACGSNASASAVAGILNGWLASKVQVDFRYGSLWIEWDGEHSLVYMTGPAVRVFDGQFLSL